MMPKEEKPSVIPYLNTSLQGLRKSIDGLKSNDTIMRPLQLPPPLSTVPHYVTNRPQIEYTNVYRN
jgi:hypothetical protein